MCSLKIIIIYSMWKNGKLCIMKKNRTQNSIVFLVQLYEARLEKNTQKETSFPVLHYSSENMD